MGVFVGHPLMSHAKLRFDLAEETVKDPAYWMITESLGTWQLDEKDGFTLFGLPESGRKRASEVSAGDRLLVYVSGSGISSFAGVRRVVSGPFDFKFREHRYGRYVPIGLRTRPITTLPRDTWVKFHKLASRLSFTKNKVDWRPVLRLALRPLSKPDAQIILGEINRAATEQ